MIKKIALLVMLATALLSAQRISEIRYEGLAHLSPGAASEISGIHVGDQMNAEKINQSIKSFFAQGYFKDIWVESKGSVLIYHFEEKVAIANIEIKGYGSDGEDLLSKSGLKKGDLYDRRDVRRAKETIISNLEVQGYYDTVVEVTTSKVTESSVSVVFEVNKGEKIKINQVNFVGAEALDESDFESVMVNKEKSTLFGWIPLLGGGEAQVDQLEYDAYRVKDVYMQNGYLDAYVSKPLMRVDFGSYNATIDYKVKEGVQYRVGKVSISQNLGLDNQELQDDLRLKEGKIFDIKRMRSDINNLKEKVGNLGYAYADVSPQINKNPETQTIDLNYVVQKGVPVTVNDVLISGNNVTKDRVIRRYIYLAPGDKFNATDLKDSKNALGRTGFFEQVDIETQRISEDKINLLVKVKEAPTGTISLGGGYGSYDGFMVNANVSDKNLFGSGISSSLGVDFSQRTTNFNLSFTNPRVWDSEYSFSVSLYKKEYEYQYFTLDQTGANMSVGKEFLRYYHASVGIGYIDNQSEENNNTSASTPIGDLNDLYNDKYSKVSLFARLNFDNTDDYYTPREGMIASLNFEYAMLSGSDYNATLYPSGYGNFLKVDGKYGIYYGMEDLIDYDLILRFKARASMIETGSSNKLPTAEKLFLGGVGSLRGYESYSVSPRFDPADPDSSLIGGTKSASTSLEASIPLSEAANMRLTFFYDYGMIGEDSFSDISRSSVGAMIEWRSSFGPINLVFAQPLDDEPGDRTSAFEFSMGTKF
jgi:outer membrane protein insertion porin family